MRMTKKITSLALAVMMIASMLVVGAVSASAAVHVTTDPIQAQVEAGGTITLDADHVFTGSIQILNGNTVTIDLAGHTIQSTNDYAIYNFGTLTIKDSVGGGQVKAREACVAAHTGANTTINGGTYTAYDNGVFMGNGSTGAGNSTWNINAGTFNGYIESANYIAMGIYAPNDDVWNVNGGTFNITNGVGICQRAGVVNVAEGVVFNVTGNGNAGRCGDSQIVIPSGTGVVYDSKSNYPGQDDTDVANITGGTFNTSVAAVDYINQTGDTNKHIVVSGGAFDKAPADEFLADDVKVAEKDGTKYVVDQSSQGVITTEAELKAAAAAGGEWTLGADLEICNIKEEGGSLYWNEIDVDNDFVLDGAGHKITGKKYYADGGVDGTPGTPYYPDGTLFYMNNADVDLTVKDLVVDANGTFGWAFCAYTGNGGANAGNILTLTNVEVSGCYSWSYVSCVNQFGTSTGYYNNCNFHNNKNTADAGSANSAKSIFAGAAATVYINGGTYEEVLLHGGANNTVTATIDGGATVASLNLGYTSTNGGAEANNTRTHINDATVNNIVSSAAIDPEVVVIDPAQATVAAPDGYKWETSAETGKQTLKALCAIDGYQKKTVKSDESTEAEGNDIETKGVRIIVKSDKDFLNDCTDYGFVVAKYTGNKAQKDLDFSTLDLTSGNGQKVIPCKDSVNSGLGLGDDYVTLAVNGMSAGEKVVVRFYYVKDNATHFASYTNVVSYDGILATMS